MKNVGVSVHLKEVKVSSYIARYAILRIAQSALHFTSLAVIFTQIPYLRSMQPYTAINARRLLAHISITCLLSELEQCRMKKKLAQCFNNAAQDSNPGPLS